MFRLSITPKNAEKGKEKRVKEYSLPKRTDSR